jgi:zinc/manganese transport system substrate-binding protein
MSAAPTSRRAAPRPTRFAFCGAVAVAALTATACSTSSSSGSSASSSGSGSGKTIQVVAAENFWGSVASQLGGSHVKVTSIINNPDADPHDYEPTAADARTVAGAQYTIVNGIGYDTWADKLLAANPVRQLQGIEQALAKATGK